MSMRAGLWCIVGALFAFMLLDFAASVIVQMADTASEPREVFEYLQYTNILHLAFALVAITGAIIAATAPTRLRPWLVIFAVAFAVAQLLLYAPWLLQKASVDLSLEQHEWFSRARWLAWTIATGAFIGAAFRWAHPAFLWSFVAAAGATALLYIAGIAFATGPFDRKPEWLLVPAAFFSTAKSSLWIFVTLDMLGGFRPPSTTPPALGAGARVMTLIAAIAMGVGAAGLSVFALGYPSGDRFPSSTLVDAGVYIAVATFAIVWQRVRT